MKSHKETLAALVAKASKDDNQQQAQINIKALAECGPSIALALEGMRLLTLYRAATKQRAEDEREHCAAGLTYSIGDLVAIEARLDALLERWEGKE